MNQRNVTCPEVTGSIAIMIRHAERHPIDTMANALEARLTAKGKKDAFKLGQRLARFSPINIYHSPVSRCRETADSLLEGIVRSEHEATIVGYLLELGGPYITGNWDAIVKNIEHFGHSLFIRKWFDNEFTPQLIMSLPEAAHTQLNILINQLRSNSSSSINITHDWNIMILREYYFNLRHEDIGDPDYLDGVCAYLHDRTLHLVYHEHERTFNIS